MSERDDPKRIGQRVALLLFEAGAIHISRQQPFILAAGWASPVYVDCRVLIGQARHAPRDHRACRRVPGVGLSGECVRRDRRRRNGGHPVRGAGSPTNPDWNCAMSANARSASDATRRSKAAPSKDCAFS